MKIYDMNDREERKKLELEINRAADGELTPVEITELEQRLSQYPDLLLTYRDIMDLPDFSLAYPIHSSESTVYDSQINKVYELIEMEENKLQNFADSSLFWFKRYALAASVAIVAIVSGFYINFNETEETEAAMQQLLYPEEDGDAETYVLYLEELFDQ